MLSIKQFQKPAHFVSFSIPCYNCAATVVESLDSIYQLKLNLPFEIICTDDASPDATMQVLTRYQQTHPEVRVFAHAQNRGGGATRNTCVGHARGDLIFNLDSDNVLVPGSVGRLVELLDQTGCDIAVFETIRYFNGQFNQTHSAAYEAPGGLFTLQELMENKKVPPSGGNYLFTKASYLRAQGYPEQHGAADTWGFGCRQLALGFKMALLKDSYYWHRLSGDSYWVRDNVSGRLRDAYYDIVMERPELFTAESFRYLAECKAKGVNFDEQRIQRKFVLIPQAAREHLFAAYRYEYEARYALAGDGYARAIAAGADANAVAPRLRALAAKQP